jgi:hypothetical protein
MFSAQAFNKTCIKNISNTLNYSLTELNLKLKSLLFYISIAFRSPFFSLTLTDSQTKSTPLYIGNYL